MAGALGAMVGQGETAPPPVTVSITDQYVYDSSVDETASAYYYLTSAGQVLNHDGAILENWLLGGGTASNYEVYATATSGSVTSGTTGSWLNLGTTRSWGVLNGAQNNSTVTAVITVSIRLASSGVVQDTATITLAAESDNFR